MGNTAQPRLERNRASAMFELVRGPDPVSPPSSRYLEVHIECCSRVHVDSKGVYHVWVNAKETYPRRILVGVAARTCMKRARDGGELQERGRRLSARRMGATRAGCPQKKWRKGRGGSRSHIRDSPSSLPPRLFFCPRSDARYGRRSGFISHV